MIFLCVRVCVSWNINGGREWLKHYIYYDDRHFVKLTGNNCHFIYFGNTLEKQIMREIDGIV